ncbi:hypothetical protein CEP88_11545 [Roseobacter denitrificans]|uniref:Membrane protein, putative n=1 Tax=Roseobacter denitrificans (strain ATCC 33942 / OCh 114) TaxID=375451 RepID=Q16DH4_ROSDO|nr:hypothetical protein [Roseobacter denitrificans]ABG29969.1 membrane protein, putative [Roseobacter denitrificans OCh 114]AVL53178.1 hypothetical protein CEP88_11545 [Roseobacter denitrificans]SFG39122.1 Predicted Na+-dependent transporter [Roseobacter denitrificans OCh 114]
MLKVLLWRISENGRLALIVGLVAGLTLPGLAAALQPWLPQMVAVLLAITALRIGHRAASGALADLRWGIGSVVVLQLLLPFCLFALCWSLGLAGTPIALAAVLATAAPAISGAPNLALMLGQNGGRMMQILVLGTALFPITVLPLLWMTPQLGDPHQVLRAALSLLGVIIAATSLGFGLRAIVFPNPTEAQVKALDGLSVLAFSAIVVGLMAALNPALRNNAPEVAMWALLAFAISYGAQIVVYLFLRRSRLGPVAGPLAIGAGNRNIALFLVALPEQVMAPLMVFIGCWQLPMYMTPILLRWLYKPEG